MNPTPPKVTIGILSWNRLHYLRATLLSARECIDYPNLEWIVSDNESIEPGLREFVDEQDWVDHKVFKTQSHAEAMNEIMDMATGEYVIIWPEDVQFITKGDWLSDMVAMLEANEDVGSLCMDFLRRSTIHDIRHPSIRQHRPRFLDEIWRYGWRFRRSREVLSPAGRRYYTFGWTKAGICGSGIPSLTRTSLWRELGPWRVRGKRDQIGLIDSSLGAEEDMVQRFFATRRPIQGAAPFVPVAADILTDPLGCKAKVRGSIRYGVYMPPPEPPYYYRIRPLDEIASLAGDGPVSFAQGVIPQGFEMPVDDKGERLKFSFNTSVQFDIARNEPIPYPMQAG